MSEISRPPRLEKGQTKLKNVPIAVTPEGFWCCPSPAVFQKSFKSQTSPNKPKPSSQSLQSKKLSINQTTKADLDEKISNASDSIVLNDPLPNEKAPRPKQKADNPPSRKVSIEYGEAGTSDLKLILLGKQGITVKLSVHRTVLEENSIFFSAKISEQPTVFPCLEIDNCDDVEIYAETIGLMYCREMKQQLIKQSVPRVLRILKVGERLGFAKCIQSCLEYLEAVPWVGQEEEDKVVSSVLCLEREGIINGVRPILKRVSSDATNLPQDTFRHILESVLKSREEKGRREMKSVVLKLLRESNSVPSSSASSDQCNEALYSSCRTALDSLLSLFREAAGPDFSDGHASIREPVAKLIALEADNLVWLLDILSDRQAADDFAVMWASQQELASLHARLPVAIRHHASLVSARVFVLIGKGEVLPCKDARHSLLKTWLEALMNDYKWLQHGWCSRWFERDVVEEGIGRTILTLPLEDQQSILLSWLGSFLKTGDNCPNLQRAFEVWWRRTFVRPCVEGAAAAAAGGIIVQQQEENEVVTTVKVEDL